MAAEITFDSFWDLLRQSGLVAEERILALKGELASDRAKADGSRPLAEELVRRGVLTQWQADNLLQGKCKGFHLGAYRILKPLGQGGMSKVFLAQHEMMGRRCAIKILPSRYQEDPDLLNRFRLEAFATARLDHPNIVRAYDFNKDIRWGREIAFFVMEYIEGRDLRQMVTDDGPLECGKAADYISQAAEGLAHAHQAGFVHRDIKPANLLVDPNGVLKILDLGLARFTVEEEQPWQTSEGEQSAVGTADYVAPEQVADSRTVDGRSDIYSLGLTFYYLLTGRRPFPKATLMELLMAHRNERPEPIVNFRPDAPLELITIIERMTAKSSAQRFQTAKEVAEKIRAWLRESAGGREYSRISALMAAAMRAKQQDSARAKLEPNGGAKRTWSESGDLELAALDDEPRTPAAKALAKAEPAAARKPAAANVNGSSGSGVHGTRQAATASKRPTNVRADVLAELLPDGFISSPSSSGPLITLPPEEDYGGFALPSYRPPLSLGRMLKSPWLWTGVIWAAAFVLLLWLVLR